MSNSNPHIAEVLLNRAHSPTSATRIFQDKVLTRPLLLQPSSPPSSVRNARDARQLRRKQERAKRRKPSQPVPLSAKQTRALCVYDIPREQRKYAIYEPLHRMWCTYIREALELGGSSAKYVTAMDAGPKLAAADFHGAQIKVVRSRCVGRVGARGIVVKDTKFTFEIVTKSNELRTIPKEHTVFRVEVPWTDSTEASPEANADDTSKSQKPNLVFEIHGSHFEHKAPERARKQFKQHHIPDL